MMITMKRAVVALLPIASLIASHIWFSTSFGRYRPGVLPKVESSPHRMEAAAPEGAARNFRAGSTSRGSQVL
jgi:hypothetical protein